MLEQFEKLKREIGSLPSKKNIVCLLLYGSTTTSPENADDFDAILIVKKVDTSLNDLFDLLKSKYKKLDVNVYTLEEIEKDLSYYTREFKLEYQAKAISVYGKNILIDEYKKVTKYKYKQSIMIRSIEYIQNVRLKYLTSFLDDSQKIKYMKKYFIRICKGLLLFYDYDTHTSVNKLSDLEVINKVVSLGILESKPKSFDKINVDDLFNCFKLLDKAVIKSRVDFKKSEKIYGKIKSFLNYRMKLTV
jgi:hypothetical protein